MRILARSIFYPVLIVLLTLRLSGCDSDTSAPTEQVVRPAKLMQIESTEFANRREYPGTIKATYRADLGFEIPGKLIEFPVEEGKIFKTGELIGQLDPREHEQNLASADATLAEAKVNFDRMTSLLKDGVVPKSTYDEAEAGYKVALADRNNAQKTLDDTTLLAPFDGRIGRKFVTNYELIQTHQPVANLQDIDQLEIEINMPEQVLATLKEGENYEVHAKFNFLPNQTFPLTIKEFATLADPVTQTYAITFYFPKQEKHNLLPGMSASVVINLKKEGQENRFFVPVTSVFSQGNKQYVWVVSPQTNKIHKKAVTTGGLAQNTIAITGGLKPGDTIVTAGVNLLREDMQVRPYQKGDYGEIQ